MQFHVGNTLGLIDEFALMLAAQHHAATNLLFFEQVVITSSSRDVGITESCAEKYKPPAISPGWFLMTQQDNACCRTLSNTQAEQRGKGHS